MLAILALLLGVTLASDMWRQDIVKDFDSCDHKGCFEDWKQAFGKTYPNEDENSRRFGIFMDNWRIVNDHNTADHSWKLGMNQFGDLTVDEFQMQVFGRLGGCLLPKGDAMPSFDINKQSAGVSANPATVDWTNVGGKSYVTPVKNQGQCGSCWAFSTTGSMESRHAIKNGNTDSAITSLSEQELVDCSNAQGNQGCNGGLMDNAFKYIEKENGLCSESEYKYTARDGTCKASTCGTHYDAISTYTDVKSDSTGDLETAVVAGPVSVAVDAGGTTWQLYKSGIVDGHCGVLLDHGVLAVGYDNSGSENYWRVKNSWGPSWGMNGYILICKDCNKNGNQGECGINKEPSYPVFA
jgi:cathepsin L